MPISKASILPNYGAVIAALTVGNKRMPNDVLFTTNTTLADLPGISSPTLLAGLTYSFEIALPAQGAGTGGYKILFTSADTLTATSMVFQGSMLIGAGGAVTPFIILGTSLPAGANTNTTNDSNTCININGTITVGTGGSFKVQAAQNSANGTSTFLRGGFIRVWGPY